MNVALIVLPNSEVPVAPPLTLAYVAAVLEQRRHIVRIYDLALSPDVPLAVSFRPLRTFRPQLVVVVSDQPDLLDDAVALLRDQHSTVLPLHLGRNDWAVGRVCAQVLVQIDQQLSSKRDKIVINYQELSDTLFIDSIDQLPLPARHLLSLERYNLRAVGNELQTTVLIGVPHSASDDGLVLRSPAQIVAELRSVSREYGIRHYLLLGGELTADIEWLREFLTRLQDATLHIGWEGIARAELLDESLLAQMARSGCETLRFDFNATRVFDSAKARAQLKQTVAHARQFGIYARADLELEPPYEAIPYLVDVAATFGLDDVSFKVKSARTRDETCLADTEGDLQIEEFARQRYYAGRHRQQMIDRFGAALGILLWKLRNSRIGLVLESERVAAGLEEREVESA